MGSLDKVLALWQPPLSLTRWTCCGGRIQAGSAAEGMAQRGPYPVGGGYGLEEGPNKDGGHLAKKNELPPREVAVSLASSDIEKSILLAKSRARSGEHLEVSKSAHDELTGIRNETRGRKGEYVRLEGGLHGDLVDNGGGINTGISVHQRCCLAVLESMQQTICCSWGVGITRDSEHVRVAIGLSTIQPNDGRKVVGVNRVLDIGRD